MKPHVRGSEPIRAGAEEEWVRAYQECVGQLLGVLGPSASRPMKIEQHQSKALRIERSLGRLTDADYEALIEGAMLAGTHWFNMLLHRKQLFPETRDAMHAEFLTRR